MQIKVKESAFARLRERGFRPFGYDLKRRNYTYNLKENQVADFLSVLTLEDKYEAKE